MARHVVRDVPCAGRKNAVPAWELPETHTGFPTNDQGAFGNDRGRRHEFRLIGPFPGEYHVSSLADQSDQLRSTTESSDDEYEDGIQPRRSPLIFDLKDIELTTGPYKVQLLTELKRAGVRVGL